MRITRFRFIFAFVLIACSVVAAAEMPRLQKTAHGWQFLVDGKPFIMLGAQPWTSYGPTAMVTALDVVSPIEMTTGTAVPLGVAAGTCAFTWYSPTNPGARPEKETWAGTLPMVTVGVVVVSASWLLVAGDPLGG